jgi:hypothetical protein
MSTSNGNVGNETELGMMIPTIKSQILQVSQKQREYDIDFYGSMTTAGAQLMWEHEVDVGASSTSITGNGARKNA